MRSIRCSEHRDDSPRVADKESPLWFKAEFSEKYLIKLWGILRVDPREVSEMVHPIKDYLTGGSEEGGQIRG